MKIALDAAGGDYAPQAMISGSKSALSTYSDIETLFLTGPQDLIHNELKSQNFNDKRIEIIDAPEIVAMNESGALALRKKKKSSVAVAIDLVKSGAAQAAISAGNTGAAVAAATIKLRLLEGVERPGIASPIPNKHKVINLMDAGANPDAKVQHLIAYAIMSGVYAQKVYNIKRPTIGLVSNGEEEEKGSEFTKETFKALKELIAQHGDKLPFEFIGNIEGHDLFTGDVDVALCEGFVGNVVLKSCEATAKALTTMLKEEIMSNPLNKLGGLLARGAFKRVKEKLSPDQVGGSPLLGVKGNVMISHGGASALAIHNAIRMSRDSIKHNVNGHLETALKQFITH